LQLAPRRPNPPYSPQKSRDFRSGERIPRLRDRHSVARLHGARILRVSACLRTSPEAIGTANDEIHPDTEPVKLPIGLFIATIPAGSFRRHGDSSYRFEGVIDDVRLEARIEQTGFALPIQRRGERSAAYTFAW
jgi:hypothetical protein